MEVEIRFLQPRDPCCAITKRMGNDPSTRAKAVPSLSQSPLAPIPLIESMRVMVPPKVEQIPSTDLQLLVLTYALQDFENLFVCASKEGDLTLMKWLHRTFCISKATLDRALDQADSPDTARWLIDVIHPVSPTGPSLVSILEQGIERDKKHRYRGVKGDLFLLQDLGEDLSLDGSVFVVEKKVHDQRFSLEKYRRVASRTFLQDLEGFDMKGFVVAGGAVSSALYNEAKRKPKDVDIFIVGLSNQEAIAKINALASHLHSRTTTHSPLIVQRTQRAISFGPLLGTTCIQVVLRLYSTISEVLHCFDLGASAVADDGHQLYFTTLGKIAHERRLNVLDLSRRQASYEYRIAKYLEKGFRFAIPNVDVGKVFMECSSDDDSFRFPYLELNFRKQWSRDDLKERKLRIEWSKPSFQQTTVGLPWVSSLDKTPRSRRKDLLPSVYGAGWYGYRLACTASNLESFRKEKLENICAYTVYCPGMNVNDIQPVFPFQDLCDIWTSCKTEPLKERYLRPWLRQIFESPDLEVKEDALGEFCRGWGKKLENLTRSDLEFSAIANGDGDIGFNQVFHSAVMKEEEWLGDFFYNRGK